MHISACVLERKPFQRKQFYQAELWEKKMKLERLKCRTKVQIGTWRKSKDESWEIVEM